MAKCNGLRVDEQTFQTEYRKINKFVSENSNGRIYFIRADGSKCFDNLSHSAIRRLFHTLLASPDYYLLELVIIDRLTSLDFSIEGIEHEYKPRVKTVFRVIQEDEDQLILDLLSMPMGSVYIVKSIHKIHKYELEAVISEHILHNIVSIGQLYFMQTRGIPQGSPISVALSNALLQAIDSDVLSTLGRIRLDRAITTGENTSLVLKDSGTQHFTDNNYVYLRNQDDILILTTDINKAQAVLYQLQHGWPSIGFFISNEKLVTNFIDNCYSTSIPWRGYYITLQSEQAHIQTVNSLSIRINWTKFSKQTNLDLLNNLHCVSESRMYTVVKLSQLMRPRCWANMWLWCPLQLYLGGSYQALMETCILCSHYTLRYAANSTQPSDLTKLTFSCINAFIRISWHHAFKSWFHLKDIALVKVQFEDVWWFALYSTIPTLKSYIINTSIKCTLATKQVVKSHYYKLRIYTRRKSVH